jgi:hypothetical protein
MKEANIVVAFSTWLTSEGWTIEREPGHTDMIATRGAQMLVAEAKGRSDSPGLDVDTLYGQLLRRMRPCPPDVEVRYAVVVPARARASALRVLDSVRATLNIDVYTVSEDGVVVEN